MTATFYYQTTDLGNQAVRLGSIGGFTTNAGGGSVGTSAIAIDDPTGALTLDPFRLFTFYEDASGSSKVIWKGWAALRGVERADSLIVGAARRWTVDLEDLNAILYMRIITGTAGDRPAETDVERVAWLLGSPYLRVLNQGGSLQVYDNGRVASTSGHAMSKSNYRGRYAYEVLSDCAASSGRDFFIYYDQSATPGQEISLFYALPTTTLATCTLSVSNVLSDLSSTCFAPIDPKLARDPSRVYSGLYMPYSGGNVFVTVAGRTLTRDTTAPAAGTTSRSIALARAQRMLDDYGDEHDVVTCTIKVPASQVHLITNGMRISCRFTHLPGYETAVYKRITQLTVAQDEQSDQFYNVTLRLEASIQANFGRSAPEDSTTWPSQQPPFQPGATGTFTYIQSAKTTSTPSEAVYGAAATAGNLLVIMAIAQQPGGSYTNVTATFPAGFTEVISSGLPDTTDSRLARLFLATKIADGGETTIDVDFFVDGDPWEGYLCIAEYSLGGGTPNVIDQHDGSYTPTSATATIPSLTPTSGAPSLLLAVVGHEPDYASTASAGWTIRQEFRTGGGSRQALAFTEQIVSSASGSYTGTMTGGGGVDDNWLIPDVVLCMDVGSPVPDQPVAPESAVSNGTTTTYTTAYPYVPGSLVVKVGGLDTTVTETDPTAGTFTLPSAPPAGTVITWTYNAASSTPTGTSNPAPTPATPGVPTVSVVLTNKSGGSVAKGDVVIVDTTNDSSFTTTTSAGVTSPVGVVLESIASNATGRVAVEGYVDLINVPSSQTRGYYLATHTVAKQATGAASRTAGSFAILLTGGTTPAALLFGVPDNTATSPLTTKGDIFTHSTVDTRLPVGSDGTVLVSDSTQTTGLRWHDDIFILISDSTADFLTTEDGTAFLSEG